MTDGYSELSVVVPTHGGVNRLPRLLDSLERQTLDRSSWEVVFVCNGADDGSVKRLLEWSEESDVVSRVLRTPETGAGLARNLGISSARGEIITFVDDDDWIEPRFLEVGHKHTTDRRVAFLPIKDEVAGNLSEENSLNTRRKMLAGTSIPIHDAPWALGFNACKFVPASLLKQWRYNEQLRSGEDVVFFANLLRVENLEFCVPQDEDASAYVRNVREDSISRRPESFEFNVAQRLDVIAELRKTPIASKSASALESLISSQFGFVAKRLRAQPDELAKAANYSIAAGAIGLNWKHAHQQAAQRLVFSYCFPPFADPAANVVAKRISRNQQVVDVVSADMSAVRRIDSSTRLLVDPWVHEHYLVSGYPSFASWPAIAEFAQKAVRAANGSYSSVYSRALWSGSHVAGSLYKIKHPAVKWEAEFSDPMRWDANGKSRSAGPARGPVAKKLERGIKAFGWRSELNTSCRDDHFAFTELATLAIADEVVFTNQNQMDLILSSYSAAFGEMVRAKSTVQPQPTPPSEAYKSVAVDLHLDRGKVNLAYFGNFYANRGLGDYAEALNCVSPEVAKNIVLHVFSDGSFESEMKQLLGSGRVVHHDPMNYLEFLAACKQFDALVVVDTDTVGTPYEKNPFLPSKLSDYLGSDTPVWSMIEQNSPLAAVSTQYVSRLGYPRQAAEQLIKIASQRG